jgi:hypothetical protein
MNITYKAVSSEGRVLKELDEATREAINSVGCLVGKNYTCMIAKYGNPPDPVGSGTFVRVGGRLFVATAKHLFEGFRGHDLVGVYWGEQDSRATVPKADIILDDGLDLAAIALATQEETSGTPLGYTQRAHAEEEPGLFVVSGVPAEKCKVDSVSRTLAVGHVSLGCVSLPTDLWPTNSAEPIRPDVDLLLNYTRDCAIDDRGAPMRQVDPRGMSGGGIWSVPRSSCGIWSPVSARLVAIQSAVEEAKWRYLRATRFAWWLRMIVDKYLDESTSLRQGGYADYP